MKLKVFLQVAILLVLSVCTAQAITITDVGRNPFYTPPLRSVDDLRYMMDVKRGEVMEGLNHAGYPELYQPLMEQFPNARISRVDYEPGQNFYWMLSKYQGYGPVHAIRDMVWGGAHSFAGYEFCIMYNGVRYTFAVPLVCGNLALKEISYNQGQGQQKWQRKDSVDSACSGYGCSNFRFVTDLGYLHQSDPADYFLIRVGLEYQISQNLSLLSMIGGAPHLDGTDGEEAFLIDFLLQYDWFRSPLFVGVGVGGWITSGDDELDAEDTDLDVIVNLGAHLYGEANTFNTSFFLEARSAVDEFDSIADYGRFGAGLRFRF